MGAVLSLIRSRTAGYEVGSNIPKSVSAKVASLHLRTLANVKMMNQGEQNLLDDLKENDDFGAFKEFGCQSLYAYAVDLLSLTPSVAYNLIAIMRRAKEVPELVQAIKDGRINVSAARKIAPVINRSNKEAWLELASTSAVSAIEKAVATASPKHAVKESIRYVTGERLQLKLGVSEEFRDTLKELKDLLSQKSQTSFDSEDAILLAMKEAIARLSPLEKAKRARIRREKKSAAKNLENASELKGASSVSSRRRPLSAETKHFVNLRDGGRCTEVDDHGARCAQTRWLDIHHVIEVSNGGDNSPENLRTVCTHHHRRIHGH